VAIGGSDQPKDDLRLQKRFLILILRVASSQKLQSVYNAGAAIVLIFQAGLDRQRLAKILLWDSREAPVVLPSSIKTFYHQGGRFTKLLDLGRGCGKSKSGDELETVKFVFDTVR
jgi:hypothetical protein